MRKIYLGMMMAAFFAACTTKKVELLSPDASLAFSVFTADDGRLMYTVAKKQGDAFSVLIEESPLGLVRSDQDFSKNLTLHSRSEIRHIEDSYTMKIGKRKKHLAIANEQVLAFENQARQPLQIVIRSYNDGIAFRYVFPDSSEEVFKIVSELTGFNLPDSGKAWLQPYDTIAYWAPAYEQFFMNGINIGTKAPEGRNGWCFPMLFHAKNSWIFISESNVDTSYCGMHLNADATGGLYTLRLPEADEAYNLFPQLPASTLPWTMPWRFIVISDSPAGIFESNRVYDLADPCRLADTSWIKPGKASWSWWSKENSAEDYKRLAQFVDFSKEMNWEYSLVDALWHKMKGGDITKLAEYGVKNNVGILLWYNSGGKFNTYMAEPRDSMDNPVIRQRELKRISKAGVKGIKVDFFQSDKQGVIKLYWDIMKDAAAEKILVNFHGCTMPRGWSRTYPNLMSMEAIRGEEAYRFDKNYPDYGPVHNTIIPFTRNVAGPVDYTPVGFSNRRFPHKTSYAHELALPVIFESGITHFADDQSEFMKLPEAALDYLRKVPTAWDSSRLIDGFPGSHVVIARALNGTWYVAGINGSSDTVMMKLELPFITADGYSLNLIRDGKDSKSIECETIAVKPEMVLTIKALPYGGFSGIISKTNN